MSYQETEYFKSQSVNSQRVYNFMYKYMNPKQQKLTNVSLRLIDQIEKQSEGKIHRYDERLQKISNSLFSMTKSLFSKNELRHTEDKEWPEIKYLGERMPFFPVNLNRNYLAAGVVPRELYEFAFQMYKKRYELTNMQIMKRNGVNISPFPCPPCVPCFVIQEMVDDCQNAVDEIKKEMHEQYLIWLNRIKKIEPKIYKVEYDRYKAHGEFFEYTMMLLIGNAELTDEEFKAFGLLKNGDAELMIHAYYRFLHNEDTRLGTNLFTPEDDYYGEDVIEMMRAKVASHQKNKTEMEEFYMKFGRPD